MKSSLYIHRCSVDHPHNVNHGWSSVVYVPYAFLGMQERAMQSIHPSFAHPYWDMTRDEHLPEFLDSPVFNIIGGRTTQGPENYVVDGVFANFPLRRNRTGLCDDFDDPEIATFCKTATYAHARWQGRGSEPLEPRACVMPYCLGLDGWSWPAVSSASSSAA